MLWAWIIGGLVWGIVWGIATQVVNEDKGYDGGFWLGFFLGIIGLIIVACKTDIRKYKDYQNSSLLSQQLSMDNEKKILENGGWKCSKCGRINANYTGSCACGMTKANYEAKKLADETATKAHEKSQQELDSIARVKAYKELLDSGILTQEEFEKKKDELLKI